MLTGAAVLVAPPSAGAAGAARAPVDVVVQATSVRAGEAAVLAAGGTVTERLPIIDGVAASVPGNRTAALAAAPGIRHVTPNAPMTVQGDVGGPTSGTAGRAAVKSVYREVVGADRVAADGYNGGGITVALLDTGITATKDLKNRVKTVQTNLIGGTAPCINLSGEPTCDDGYGHGTFLAGLIAGSGASSKGKKYAGVAPGAKLVSIKVAAADGSSDVTTVLAGIQWAVSFKSKYKIRVLNLSLGTDSQQPWTIDPLNLAVEKAWDAGLVVVVSAANRGPDAETIAKPGDDPFVITVGATDDVETVELEDDRLPDFSSRGPAPMGVAKPDLVAPGGRLVSLDAPGSSIADRFPSTMAPPYRRGSGTSMSTAVVSGAVALMLDVNPGISPNRVKFALASTARDVASDDPSAVGAGMIDAYAAAFDAPSGLANEGLVMGDGSGSLDDSRANLLVSIGDGDVVEGLETALAGITYYVAQLLFPSWTPANWWLSYSIFGPTGILTSWYGHNWEGHNWEGCTFQGVDDDCDYGGSLPGSTWYGAWD